MSTKFFTWTKGDRNNLPEALRKNGVVPIPAECISIKGVDFGQGIKRPNKLSAPSPVLNFEDNTERTSTHNNSNSNSLALHDAAVQSATNLMAVMNDMLRSPPMSAHLFSQTYPPRLTPMHGRPRSKTAPSTPLVEAASTEYVELPGSFPFDQNPQHGVSMHVKAEEPSASRDLDARPGPNLSRPHSSPQNGAYASPKPQIIASPWLSPLPIVTPPHSQDTVPRPSENHLCAAASNNLSVFRVRSVSSDQAKLAGSTEVSLSSSVKAQSLPASLSTSRSASATEVARIKHTGGQIYTEDLAPDGSRNFLEEIVGLRKSHEAHVESLRVAHQQEINSYRSYISLLESRELELNSRQTQRVQERIQKTQESERQLRNTITDLEARLEAANNERTDVLEGYHNACTRVRELSQQARNPIPWSTPLPRHKRAASDACRFEAPTSPTWQQIHDLRQVLASKDSQIRQLQDAALLHTAEAQDSAKNTQDLQQALEKYKEMMANARDDAERYNSLLHHEIRRQTHTALNATSRDTAKMEAHASVIANEKMVRLKAQHSQQASESHPAGASVTCSSTSSDLLERELEHCIKEIINYKMDAKALHKDLRKSQAKIDSLQAIHLHQPPTPDGESTTSTRSQLSPEVTRSTPARPPPPHERSTPTPTQPGLGITFAERQARSSESVTFATAAALTSSTTSPQPLSTSSSPFPRPRTPMAVHKKLPKPPLSPRRPPLPISPPPSNEKLQRTGTQRSVSESIISSYAQPGFSE